MTEIIFGKNLENLLAKIGEELGIKFSEFNVADYQTGYKSGDWTYKENQLREIEISLWFGCDRRESRTIQVTLYHDGDWTKLETDLHEAVTELRYNKKYEIRF